MPRQIRLNAFDMACVGHIQQGLWTHPRDRSTDYHRIEHWTGLARTLERGLFDGLFLADVMGIYDVFGGSPDAALRGAVQVPLLDPAVLVPAMAAATTDLGFGITCNLAYEQPFLFARRMSSLDHLTGGRVGWNIVTGYLDSAARAMGFDRQMAHDDRYDLADEYMEVVYALWEGSWADGAVRADRAGGLYADPALVRPARHHGRQFRMEAIHLCEPSPQRTPLLFQAGASERGRRFAATHAECVFVNGGPAPAVAALAADLRARAAGRPLQILMGATVVTGRTEAEARDRLEDYRRHASVEGALAHASASLGIDFARFGMDEPVGGAESQAIQSNIAGLQRAAGGVLTKRWLIDSFILGSRQKPLVGSGAQIAEALIGLTEAADIDGFNLSRTVMPEGLEDFVDLVVPELQARGAFKTEYAPGPWRQKLFGAPRLLAPHPAAAARHPG
ncbi:LLM class flavin-dependent oxidoreductase [Pseudoroseomonas globiformis]|uniref:LLM class flavin-dependent oxidoreductase n=1 Tax=Teichococcus globiformis TaxID=2307229 RepID=A0ABV7FXP1_9PROT